MTESSSTVSNRPLGDLLGNSLTSTPVVNVRKNAKVRVATGMLVQYLETFTDSIVVRDETKPIGIIGGREVIRGVYKNPTMGFFEMQTVDDVFDKRINVITADTTLNKLISLWKDVGRAFAIIDMGNDDYSVISVKKMMEIGISNTIDFHISEFPKKKMITCSNESTFGEVMKLMLENKTRKILLEGTNQFINDRIIIETIEKMEYLVNTENFLEIPINVVSLEDAKVVTDDLSLSDISKIMYEMSQPLVIHEDSPISPWDICMVLDKN